MSTSGIQRGVRRMTSNRVDAPGYFPTNADELRTAMGGVGIWSSAWRCDEASGALVDAIGGVTLSPVTSPLYRQAGPFGGVLGVGFDDNTMDGFNSASGTDYDLDASTSLALFMCVRFTGLTNRWIFGKSGAQGWGLQQQSAPRRIQMVAVSSVGGQVNAVAPGDTFTEQWHDVIGIIDRSAQLMACTHELGTISVDISALGTLSNAGKFHLGGLAAQTTSGMHVAFAAVATGEVRDLRLAGQEAIWNIRRFTGRA